MTEWNIQAEELANCNCNYGCPCQFGSLPSQGNCEAVVIYEIDKGHYGDVKLDGLRAGGVYHWPGPIHEGNGSMQLIIDERASPAQREALEAIMSGKDTDEMATMWFIFTAMCPNRHETIFAPIKIDWDLENVSGHASVEGVFDIEVGPIPNVVSGAPHRVSINLPGGFEFSTAELASGTSKTTGGKIQMAFDKTHAHMAKLNLTGHGIAA